jgi:hypothetical protein
VPEEYEVPGEGVADNRPETCSMRGLGSVELAGGVAWARGGGDSGGGE